jgi:hypothetical protein
MNLPKFKKGEMVVVNLSGKNDICLFEPQEIAKVIYRKNCWVYKLKGVSIHGNEYWEETEERDIVSKDEAKQIVLNYLNKFLGVK